MSGATGRQRVRDECFDQFFLAQPSKDLLARFEAITRHQFELIHSLNRRNQNLRRTRDLLLSKLLSR
jgi:type I restriction enzyme S subunit